MKLTHTTLSALRHLLTTVGGACVLSTDPKTAAAGAVLVAVGGLWGALDEHKAENPTKPSA